MPRKYKRKVTKRKTNRKKRTYRKSKLSGANPSSGLSTRPNALSAFDPLPVVLKNTFKYVNASSISTNGSPLANGLQYRMSSPYNPYVGLGGSSCQNWGLATSYYSNYLVTKCKVKLVFTDPSVDGLTIGIAPRTTGQASVVSQAMESLQADGNVTMTDLNITGSQKKTFYKTFYPWQWITPFKSRYYNDEDYSSATNNSPTLYPTFEIFIISDQGATITVNYRIDIDYEVTLYNKKFV